MSYKWPSKDPDEVLDYSIDWSRFLGTATISSVQWFIDDADGVKTAVSNSDVVNGLQRVGATNTSTTATIHLGLGTLNTSYKLHCRITDSTGSVAERSIRIAIKER